jgi:hypothetical protein
MHCQGSILLGLPVDLALTLGSLLLHVLHQLKESLTASTFGSRCLGMCWSPNAASCWLILQYAQAQNDAES